MLLLKKHGRLPILLPFFIGISKKIKINVATTFISDRQRQAKKDILSNTRGGAMNLTNDQEQWRSFVILFVPIFAKWLATGSDEDGDDDITLDSVEAKVETVITVISFLELTQYQFQSRVTIITDI